MASKKLRRDTNILFVGKEEDSISSGKLPTVRQVLCFFFGVNRDKKVPDRRTAARETIRLVLEIWERTKIPRIQEIKAIQNLEKLYTEWRDVTKHVGRSGQQQVDKVSNFTMKLDRLFDNGKKDAIEIMEYYGKRAQNGAERRLWEEEKDFYIDQQNLRVFSIGGLDAKERDKEKRRTARELNVKLREKKLNEFKERVESKEAVTDVIDDLHSDAEDECIQSTPPVKSEKRGRVDVLTPAVVEAIDVAQLSCAKATNILSAAVVAMNGSVSSTNINPTSIYRKREKLRAVSVNDMKNNMIHEVDSILTFRWDGKKVETLDRNAGSSKSLQERQAVLVDGVNTDILLGAPALPNGSAEALASAITNLLGDWRIGHCVKCLGFDTTAVNSGCTNGAAVKVETALGRELVWLPCRHHVFERVMEKVYRSVVGASNGPEDQIFNDFKTKWPSIDQSRYSTYQDLALTRRHLGSCAEEIITFARSQIEAKQPRSDYLEFLELAITYLGEQPADGVKFKVPGPTTSSRWMSVPIYCLKMILFRKQFKMEKKQEEGFLHIIIFVLRLYLKAWLSCTDSVSAPRRDLEFLKALVEYKRVNSRVAEAALTRMSTHLWYLKEVSIGLVLFDENLLCNIREGIVTNMKNMEGDEDSPKRRHIQWEDIPMITLSDLATKNTVKFFSILGLEMDFLNHPIAEWHTLDAYKHGKEVVTHLRVVNDGAERAVRLLKDYNKTATMKEESHQNLLVSVHSFRQSKPNSKKSTLVQKYDRPKSC